MNQEREPFMCGFFGHKWFELWSGFPKYEPYQIVKQGCLRCPVTRRKIYNVYGGERTHHFKTNITYLFFNADNSTVEKLNRLVKELLYVKYVETNVVPFAYEGEEFFYRMSDRSDVSIYSGPKGFHVFDPMTRL